MVRKYSATLHGHRTSFSLEEAFFEELKRIALRRGLSLASLIAEVDDARQEGNLSSALRLHVLETLRRALDDAMAGKSLIRATAAEGLIRE